MPKQEYIIKFRADGTAEVSRSVRSIGTASKKASKEAQSLKASMNGLAKVAGTLALYFGGRALLQMADGYTALTNKVRIVTESEKELIRVRTELTQISKETFSNIEANTALYQRLTFANKNLGASERDRLKFTKAISQSLAISGASAQETRSVLIQLSQGLGSVAVRGEEFRAVMESGSRIIKALSDATGLTTGEIKKLTAEGKFLSKDFFDAILSQMPQIEQDFQKIQPTVSQAGAVFKTSMQAMIGSMNEGVGITAGLANAIIKLSQNLDKVAFIAGSIAMISLVKWLKGVTISMQGLNIALTSTVKLMTQTLLLVGTFFAVYQTAKTFFEETKGGAIIMLNLAETFDTLQYKMQNFSLNMDEGEMDAYLDGLEDIQNYFVNMREQIEGTEWSSGADFGELVLANMTESINKLKGGLKDVFKEYQEPRRVIVEKPPVDLSWVEKFKADWGTFKQDFNGGIDEMIVNGQRFGQIMAETVGEAIRGVSDELAELAVEGSADFGKMAKSIVKDFISMIIQASIFKAVAGLGLGFGGTFGSATPVPTGASQFGASQFGGRIRSGEPRMVGERRPEIFMPDTAGKIIPYPKQESSEQAIRIVNQVSGDAIFNSASDSVVDRLVINSITRNSGTLRGALS